MDKEQIETVAGHMKVIGVLQAFEWVRDRVLGRSL
jgi:hypothetical protein